MEILFDEDNLGPWLDPSDNHYEYAIDARSWVEAAQDESESSVCHGLSVKDRAKALKRAENLFSVWSSLKYPDTGDELRESPKILFIPRPLFYGTEGFMFIFKADNNGNTYRFEFEYDEFSGGAGSASLSVGNLETITAYRKRKEAESNEIKTRRQNAKEKSETTIQ